MTGLLHCLSPAHLLAASWRPFLDPIDLHGLWFLLLIPLALGIAVVYRAVRVADFHNYWGRVAALTVQIVVSMVLLGIASYLFIQVAVPMLLPMPE